MPAIQRVILQNFKRFQEKLELNLSADLNVLLGDNESGKSTVLLAIDLVLSASRSRIETLGVDTLLSADAVSAFMQGKRGLEDLPVLKVELYLSDSGNPEFNGKNNLRGESCDGLSLEGAVPDENGRAVMEMLQDANAPFPFEYYTFRFSTFNGSPYFANRKHVRHLLLDSSRIDTEYASREYTRTLFTVHTEPRERSRLESEYRQSKTEFQSRRLADINDRAQGFAFAVRTSSRSNLEADLVIHEDSMPVDLRGKGRQCQIKTDFALQRGKGNGLDVLLLEEPENHLSHTATRQLVGSLTCAADRQVIVATHSSFICARLDLRKAQLLSPQGRKAATLANLTESTAAFFMKAPNNQVLEFALSGRVILVEGDAEYMLIEALYAKQSGSSLQKDGVHVISVGGTSFKRYLELAKVLAIRTAVIRDNDKNFQKNCVENYAEWADQPHIKVFAEEDDTRSTFEICLYHANQALCDEHFESPGRKLAILDYMLANKTDAAFRLLRAAGATLVAPPYIQDAIAWIRA